MSIMLMDRLIARVIETSAPIVAELTPTLDQVPARMKEEEFLTRGKTPEALARVFYRFNRAIIDHIHDLVPAVKPQIAFYEQLGVPGINCYAKTISYAKSKGLLVIGDIIAGDMFSAGKARSHGHIGKLEIDGTNHRIFDVDFITVNPYLGYDSIEPYLEDCKNYGKGIFVLVKTSNPSSDDIQNQIINAGLPLYLHVGNLVKKWGENLTGKFGYSSIGALVGINHPEEGKKLREHMPGTFFLVSSYGAKNGTKNGTQNSTKSDTNNNLITAKNLKGMINKDRSGIICSCDITGAHKLDAYKSYGEAGFAQAARASLLDMKRDLMS